MTGKFFILMIPSSGQCGMAFLSYSTLQTRSSFLVGWLEVGDQGLNILLIFMTITAFSLESDKETTDIKAIFYGA